MWQNSGNVRLRLGLEIHEIRRNEIRYRLCQFLRDVASESAGFSYEMELSIHEQVSIIRLNPAGETGLDVAFSSIKDFQ
jgi:hypothetical protein